MKSLISFNICFSLIFVILGFYYLPPWGAIPAFLLWISAIAAIPTKRVEAFEAFELLEEDDFSEESHGKKLSNPSVSITSLFGRLTTEQQKAIRATYVASGSQYDFESWLGEMTVVVSEEHGDRFIFPALSVLVQEN